MTDTTARPATVGSIRAVLDRAYPPRLAEPWDRVGLICGDPAAEVGRVAFALDCTLEVARRAVEIGADMLVVHHPFLLRGVNSVAADTPKGEVLHLLITNGVALFAAHTNADAARPGVNDRLAELVGITPGRPIEPAEPAVADHWGVHVPTDPPGALEKVSEALFAAGAGEIGNYSHCSFTLEGTGQFRPEEGADPAEGEVGETSRGREHRLEFVAPARLRGRLVAALRAAHPFEEPAFDIAPMPPEALEVDLSQAEGIGRVGELPEPMRFADFVQQVADRLPETAWGVRAAGDPELLVKTVAVSSGAGDGFLDKVRALGVDAYITSDLRHHPVDEHLRAGGPAVIDTAHWASEFPWTSQAADVVAAEGVDTEIIDIRTDPWALSAHPRRQN